MNWQRDAMVLGRRGLALAAGVLVVIVATSGIALAYWSTAGAGTASARIATLNAPTNVTAASTAGSGAATVNWTASATAGTAVAPAGYYVTRSGAGGSSPACGTSATALTTALTCSDTSVPDGTYTYAVTAVLSSWSATSVSSNEVSVSNTRPAVTVDQASGQGDPTNTAPIMFTAVFSEPVADFTAAKVVVGGTAPGAKAVSISGAGPSYTISISGMTGSGTVTASIAANTVHASSGAGNTASTSTDNSALYDITSPTAPTPSASAAITFGTSPMYVNNEVVNVRDAAQDADSGVAVVRYYVCAGATGSCGSGNGTLIGSSTNASNNYAITSNAPLATPDGIYRIVASATDNAGNTTASGPVQIAVDTTAPTASAPIVNGRS